VYFGQERLNKAVKIIQKETGSMIMLTTSNDVAWAGAGSTLCKLLLHCATASPLHLTLKQAT
jgi:hypothetical protein